MAKSDVVQVRFQPADLELLDATAERLGLSRSETLRTALRGMASTESPSPPAKGRTGSTESRPRRPAPANGALVNAVPRGPWVTKSTESALGICRTASGNLPEHPAGRVHAGRCERCGNEVD